MVEEAQGTKVPIQVFADKVTSVFVPVVLGIAALTFISWLVFPGFFKAIGVLAQGFLPWVDPSLGIVSLAILSINSMVKSGQMSVPVPMKQLLKTVYRNRLSRL